MSGLSQEVETAIRKVFYSHPKIHKAILYGSRAMGNYRNGSDIDLCLIGGGLDLRELNLIANELDDLLLPYSFDLSIENTLSDAALLEHIASKGCVFFERNS